MFYTISMVFCVWQQKRSFLVPTIDKILQYCRSELVSSSISSLSSSLSATAAEYQSSESAECSWHVSTVLYTELQPTWVCHAYYITLHYKLFMYFSGLSKNHKIHYGKWQKQYLYHYTRSMPLFLRTTWVSRYQKGVKPVWI